MNHCALPVSRHTLLNTKYRMQKEQIVNFPGRVEKRKWTSVAFWAVLLIVTIGLPCFWLWNLVDDALQKPIPREKKALSTDVSLPAPPGEVGEAVSTFSNDVKRVLKGDILDKKKVSKPRQIVYMAYSSPQKQGKAEKPEKYYNNWEPK